MHAKDAVCVVVSCDLEIFFENAFEIDDQLIVSGEVIHIVDPKDKNEEVITNDEMEKAFVENGLNIFTFQEDSDQSVEKIARCASHAVETFEKLPENKATVGVSELRRKTTINWLMKN